MFNLHEERNMLGTTLVDMYIKCGALEKSQEVFDELEEHNAVTWNALIMGYAQLRHAEEALRCLEWMRLEGCLPDSITFVCILNVCGSLKEVQNGREIHSEIVKKGFLECNSLIGNALVDMYAKCGLLSEAGEVFDKLRIKDVACWNAIISGQAYYGHGETALDYFQRMQEQGIFPNAVTFVSIFAACGGLGASTMGKDLHAEIVREDLLKSNILVGNAVVDMYVKCGELTKAQEVFDELPCRDVVSWNIIITGYAQLGLTEEVLNYYEQMQHEGLPPDIVTIVCILAACASLGAVQKGKEIHADILKEGFLATNMMIGTALVDMYAKCGELTKAEEVFDGLSVQDPLAWNALILGYTQQGYDMGALDCYERMRHSGSCPDAFTLSTIVKACGNVGVVDKGAEIYCYTIGNEVLTEDRLLLTALLDMYIKFGDLLKAEEVFDKVPSHDIVSWNILIAGYVEHGSAEEAVDCFELMQQHDVLPDEFTIISILKACGSLGSIYKGEEIYAIVVTEGLLKTSITIGNALVDMYAKCGKLKKANDLFDEFPVKDVVSWNILISGYAQYGLHDEVLNAFRRMQEMGVTPDASTFLCMLKTCGNMVTINAGQEIHDAIMKENLIEKDIAIGNAVIDMYIKFSLIPRAQEVFDGLPIKDIVSWTVLISGYAQLGKDDSVVNLFNRMLGEGIEPDLVTFTVVLTACSHAGLVDQGLMYFNVMSKVYGIAPTFEHQTCLVDLFSRAGQFDQAIVGIKEMATYDYLPVWTTLLGSCQRWGNAKVGKFAFDHVVRLDERCTAAYVSMSNIYAMQGDGE
jgi:pentatricopeptide repeat protein